jgi:flagellar motor switch protein FliN/FliY
MSETELDTAAGPDLSRVRDVQVTATVEVGRRTLKLSEAMSIAPGSIVQLEREIDSPLDLLINGQVVARGEVVVVDGDFGLRIVEVLDDPQAD